MRNVMKAATIESKFPLLVVEGDCIISKDADITVAYRVDLPELYTVTGAEYEAIHSAWNKAVKVLPDYTVIHKQDWFIRENYRPAADQGDMSFLSRSFERHFNERPYLNHTCFLYLTKTTKERMRMQSSFSSLCPGKHHPQGGKQGHNGKIPGGVRPVRAYRKRQRFCEINPADIRGNNGHAGKCGAGGKILCPVA